MIKAVPFKKGYTPWNKGLTKETDERVAESGKKTSVGRKRSFAEGKIKPWNKGLTKETSIRVARNAEKIAEAKEPHETRKVRMERCATGRRLWKEEERQYEKREHKPETKQKISRAHRYKKHEKAVNAEIESLIEQGFRCLKTGEGGVIPDIIARRKGKVYAVEITTSGSFDYDKYTGEPGIFFDDIIWIVRKEQFDTLKFTKSEFDKVMRR